ncbi:AtpZ/AtpI family protein [Arcobacter arenosus]|jgi:F0F1-type ATP synthase assembly protein I|uniref:AtpZ/AtpI family protein n=1 Tax=Arcobacter arenosus TaxID=2576037 RepID=A0A5R8Y338_9BACT|nr:AtpZ/AtpI family protein [Arcobacter arenosus]TLP40486.1 AtpZ/AtpI family protein [Arcobacter arenosus]
MENKQEKVVPKHRDKLEALDNLSLGISIVAAIALGFAVGYGLKTWTGYAWTLWLGIFWGIAAAGLNIYKAYKRAQKQFEGMENDPRYAHRAKYGDKSYDEDE